MGQPKFAQETEPFEQQLENMPQFLKDIIMSERAAGNRTDVIVKEPGRKKPPMPFEVRRKKQRKLIEVEDGIESDR